MSLRDVVTVCVCLILGSVSFARAQSPDYAASARVVNPGVTYTIVSGVGTFTLREDTVVAVTAGDTLTTDREGRVYLRFGEQLEMLLLPNSRLEVLENRGSPATGLGLRLRLDGHIVSRNASAQQEELQLELLVRDSVVRSDDGWFALWSDIEGGIVATVAGGTVIVETDTERQELMIGQGMTIIGENVRVTPMDHPYNGARLVGLLSGCDGQVEILTDVLNIRAGTTPGYSVIGYLEDGATVRLIGVTESGVWYRIQRYSGFGWVLANGVQTDCSPPEYPNQFGENNRELINVEAIELDLLTPFYGAFGEDVWFYRWLENP
ncbi:MAG: SH3 domain-containing protein [Chloroflexota bacterium]|nr:SH3 domain-containing protein [Chloroflexota bacterium]